MLSVSIFAATTYILGWLLIHMKISKNISKKFLFSYMFYTFFAKTIIYMINPIISIIILFLADYSRELFPHMLPSNSEEIPEDVTPENYINQELIGELAESANGLDICERSAQMCQAYKDLLVRLYEDNSRNNINPSVFTDIINFREELKILYTDGRTYVPETSMSTFAHKTVRIGPNELFGPRADNYLLKNIRILDSQLIGLNGFINTFRSDFERLSREVANDFKSKIKSDSYISETELISAVEKTVKTYRDMSSKTIGNNIAKELGFEKLSEIKFRY